MRKRLIGVSMAALTLTLPVGTGQATSPKQDFVEGTAQHLGADPPYPTIEVRISARSNTDGTSARGRVSVQGTSPVQTYRGRVTCLSISGNRATVGIEIVSSTDPTMEGQGELWSVVDGAATGEPDRIAGYALTSEPPTACPELSFNVPVVSGDYRVNDAS